MRISFRSKIALGSALYSGLFLGLFGITFLGIIHTLGLDRIDREMQALGQGATSRQHGSPYWDEYGETFRDIIQPSREEDWNLFVGNVRGQTLYQSEDWPEALTPRVEAWALSQARAEESIDSAIRDHASVINNQTTLRKEQRDELLKDVKDLYALGVPDAQIENHVRRALARMGGSRTGEGRGGSRGGRHVPAMASPILSSFKTIRTEDGAWRVAFMGNELVNFIVAVNLDHLHAKHRDFRNKLLFIAPFALLLLAIGGRTIAGRALRPVGVIAETVSHVRASELDQRIPTFQADKEFEQLTGILNSMLERLERGFHQATRFTADAAHELNSPLAVLQGELDRMIQQAPENSEEQRGYHNLLEEVQRLKGITHKLLLLSRADAGQLPLDKQLINISELAGNTAEDAEVIAGPIKVSSAILPNIKVSADHTLICQVTNNLLTNAIKYNRKENGWIRIGLSMKNGMIQFSMTSSGENLDQLDTEKIFERFYRADSSRKRDGFGAGLGLSISREIARVHGGDLIVENLTDESVTFVLSLPEA
jgi:signal transduction histidine kinase